MSSEPLLPLHDPKAADRRARPSELRATTEGESTATAIARKKAKVPPPPKELHEVLQEHRSDPLAMLLGPAIWVPFAACYAALVCQQPELRSYFPLVLQSIMWSQLVGAICALNFGQFLTTANMDPLTAILFGQMAHRTVLLFKDDPQNFFPNFYFMMILCTFALGLTLYAIGRFKLAFMLRFFPYTVVGGFLAGSGLLILLESMNLSAGRPVPQLATDTAMTIWNGGSLTDVGDKWTQLLFGLLYAGATFAVKRLTTFATPVVLVTSVCSMIWVRSLTGGAFPPAGWYIDYPDPISWWAPFEAYAEGVVSFEPTKIIVPELVSVYIVIMAVSWSLNTVALKKLVKLQPSVVRYDDQYEIESLGKWNLILGGLGCHSMMQSFKVPMLMDEVKASHWWPLFNLAVSIVIFFFSPRVIVQNVPRFLFAGTVIKLALDLIIEWLIESRHRVAQQEWYILIASAVAIGLNVSMGILFGLFLTLVHFAMEYSGVTGAIRSGTLATMHSSIERNQQEIDLLRTFGHRVRITWLSGYLFFGSVTGAVDEARTYLEDEEVRLIVLDFSRVPAMDASGVYAILDLMEEMHQHHSSCELVLCGLVRRLNLALTNAAKQMEISEERQEKAFYHSLDKALRFAEETIFAQLVEEGAAAPRSTSHNFYKIDSSGAVAAMVKDNDATLEALWRLLLRTEIGEWDKKGVIVSQLRAAGEFKEYESGTKIFDKDTQAEELVILVEGCVEVTHPAKESDLHLPRHHLNHAKGDVYVFEEEYSRRVRRGTIFGASEYVDFKLPSECEDDYEMKPSVTLGSSGTAVGLVRVFAIPFTRLRKIEMADVTVCAVLRTWLSRVAIHAWKAQQKRDYAQQGIQLDNDVPLTLKRAISTVSDN